MEEIKLTHVCTKKVDNGEIEIYKIAGYTVRKRTYSDGSRYITIDPDKLAYLPLIDCRTDMEGNILDFEIQTTSYGTLPTGEIKKMVEALETAVSVVEILKKTF